MKNLLLVAFLFLIGIAALGFYRGWFGLSTDSSDRTPSATITVDKDKIHADEETARQKVHGLGQTVKQ